MVQHMTPKNKLYSVFLADVIQVFDEINTKLQAEEPKVHILRESLHGFLRNLLLRFVKPSAMQYKMVTDVDFKTKYNIRQKSDIMIGDEARAFIAQATANHLRKERVEEFYESVQAFYKASCSYILKKLPLSDELLKHAEVVNPRKQVDASFASLEYFLLRFPKLKHPDAAVSDIHLEFSRYQCADIRQCIADTKRVDETWREMSKLKEDGEPAFKFLPTVMLSILTIPHSSAHCERIFSVVRKNHTDFRGSMGCDTLEALVVAKSRPGSALDRSYSHKQLQDLKSAYYRSLQPQHS
ncbi:uncharacterized protein LOC143285992 [Babylonia areolata]|uniref:uncharacterized protein LOC143285992 n=1 Tax=Babylonia areolata TaxID=304850 RepID=UPI003FD50E68